MAIRTLEYIKNLFRTGKKPTEQEFHDTWDSFFHKYDQIPFNNIKRGYPFGVFQIFKSADNTDPENQNTIEAGDVVCGFVQPERIIWAKFMGGEVTDMDNFSIASEIDFQEFILPPPTPDIPIDPEI